jgi:DNA-binding PadR family transcriptional regulator
VQLLVVKTLSLGPTHGCGIAQRIQQRAEGMLLVEEGTLHPALFRSEQRGLIAAESGAREKGRRARFYTLTRSERKQRRKEKRYWRALELASRMQEQGFDVRGGGSLVCLAIWAETPRGRVPSKFADSQRSRGNLLSVIH